MYEKLAGMTGTAATEAEEFKKIYNLDVTIIPTNKKMIRVDHGDVVYKNQRAKYAAIVKEIEECYQKGQPVLVGTTSVAKNEIIDQFLTHKKVPHALLNAKQHQKEAEIISQAGERSAVTIATNMAGRGVDIILGGAMPQKIDFETEKEYEKAIETWKGKHNEITSLGGLHVIGTERHESRRIDNQLRGRSGRQGDPGSSRFFVALDDDLMRIFGGDQISSLMTRFNMEEDVPLEHGMVSRAIEQAQVKVEGFNFDMRKQVVEYDDVMNKQREIIYSLRKKALEASQQSATAGEDKQVILKEEILKKIEAEISNLVAVYSPEGYSEPEYEKIILEFIEIVPFDNKSQEELKTQISKYKEREGIIGFLLKIVRDLYENREKTLGEEIARQIERYVYLSTIDHLWIDHLTAVDDLRDGIGLRGYAQRDPLVEYKKEAFEMFEKLIYQVDYEVVRKIFRVQVMAQQPAVSLGRATEGRGKGSGHTKTDDLPTTVGTQPVTSHSVGRNDPCPCGAVDPQTGKPKKYKKCCYPKFG